MRAELARKIASHLRVDGVHATDVSGMELYRRSAPTACTSATYERKLIVFAQGRKRINVGKTTYMCDGSTFLLTSVDLPVVSQVITASEKEPILGLLLRLEMPVVRDILSRRNFICARNLPTPAAWPSASRRSSCWTRAPGS